MAYNLSFGICAVIIAVSVLITLYCGIVKKYRFITIVQIITAGTFLSTVVCLYPIFMSECTLAKNIETLFVSIVNALQIFTINADISGLIEKIEDVDFFFKEKYIFLVTFFSVLAPFLTASF